MIKYIIHTADIHIRNHRRMEEYQNKLQWFIDECKNICCEHDPNEVAVVISGDLLHSKTDISPEAYAMASWLLNCLDETCKTIVIAGNHDKIENNDRLDPLTAIFSMCNFKQTYYLDKELNYQSGCLIDDNIIWCLYSSFDNFNKPNIDEIKISNPDSVYIGLFHGEVKSSKTDAGYQSSIGFDASYFDGLNFCLMGHIHKRQTIDYEGIKLVYPGSLIQQDHGENLSNHGYLLWNVYEETFESKNFTEDSYGFYTFEIKKIEDLDENNEELINL